MEMLRLLDDLSVPVRDCNVSMVMSNNTGIYMFFSGQDVALGWRHTTTIHNITRHVGLKWLKYKHCVLSLQAHTQTSYTWDYVGYVLFSQ